jgi:hypothetical protein
MKEKKDKKLVSNDGIIEVTKDSNGDIFITHTRTGLKIKVGTHFTRSYDAFYLTSEDDLTVKKERLVSSNVIVVHDQ